MRDDSGIGCNLSFMRGDSGTGCKLSFVRIAGLAVN